MRIRLVLAAALVAACLATPPTATAATWWRPAVDATFQLQLQGRIDTSVDADVYDVDGFDTPASTVATLHGHGRHVVCYISAGSWEDWRRDADDFPRVVLGKQLDGWPGERWLDIRRRDLLRPIMRARVAMCARKGFDAIDFDNVDGRSNDTGFPLTRADQIAYDRMLARLAHDAGLGAGLKNAPALVPDLHEHFDFAVVEQCFQYRECGAYTPFVASGEPVFAIEYELERWQFCDRAEQRGFMAQRKRLSLYAWHRPCWTS